MIHKPKQRRISVGSCKERTTIVQVAFVSAHPMCATAYQIYIMWVVDRIRYAVQVNLEPGGASPQTSLGKISIVISHFRCVTYNP